MKLLSNTYKILFLVPALITQSSNSFQETTHQQLLTEKKVYTTKPYGLGYSLKKATSWKELQLLIKQYQKVVIYVIAYWCPFCWTMTPRVKKVADSQTTDVVIIKVNIDDIPELKDTYGVTSFPTFLFIENGNVKSIQKGCRPKEVFLNFINQFAQS